LILSVSYIVLDKAKFANGFLVPVKPLTDVNLLIRRYRAVQQVHREPWNHNDPKQERFAEERTAKFGVNAEECAGYARQANGRADQVQIFNRMLRFGRIGWWADCASP
jgi:hypothetical protein